MSPGLQRGAATFHFGRETPTARAYRPPEGGRLTMYTLVSGQARVAVDGAVHRLTAGHSLAVCSRQSHVYLPDATGGHLMQWCEAAHPGGLALAADDVGLLQRPFPTSERARTLHSLGEQACASLDAYGLELRAHLGHALVFEFLASVSTLSRPAADEDVVTRVRRLLLDDLARGWTAAGIAGALGLSVKTLARTMRRQAGEGVTDLLWRLRLDKAVRLIAESALQVQDIAETCGFQSPYHFSRKVKQHTGHAPTALRARAASLAPRERLDFLRTFGDAAARSRRIAAAQAESPRELGAVLARQAVAREADLHA